MARRSPLQRILEPLTIEGFVDKYFEKRPLLIRGKPGKFDFLFQQREFLVSLDRAEYLRAVFPQNRSARIRPADIKHMVEAGATICVNGMEMAHPKLLRGARLVRSELNYSGDVSFRAYLSPPQAGFDLHFDARVTTTLQIAGSKRWWFSKEPAITFPMHNSGRDPSGSPLPYKVPRQKDLDTVVLHPGDVLCLPAGVWHQAKATTSCLALNMALDHNGAGIFDSIVGMLAHRLKQDPAWRRPLPAAPNHRRNRVPETVAGALRERIDALQMELSGLRDNDLELFRAWQLATRPPAS
jgi:ribosomal protein L16 Arg81 hydroxylase